MVVLPCWLTDVSVPDIVRQDALGLVLQHLHTPGLRQSCGLWLEQDNGLHAATLSGVRRQVSEPEQARQMLGTIRHAMCLQITWR